MLRLFDQGPTTMQQMLASGPNIVGGIAFAYDVETLRMRKLWAGVFG